MLYRYTFHFHWQLLTLLSPSNLIICQPLLFDSNIVPLRSLSIQTHGQAVRQDGTVRGFLTIMSVIANQKCTNLTTLRSTEPLRNVVPNISQDPRRAWKIVRLHMHHSHGNSTSLAQMKQGLCHQMIIKSLGFLI